MQLLFLNLFGVEGETMRIDDVTVSELEPGGSSRFVRGDSNGDGQVGGVTDAVFLLSFNFLGGGVPPCRAACDSNGDGQIGGVTDAVYSLSFNFLGGPMPPGPFPKCGAAELATDGALGCEIAEACQ
ncbi:MAG: hypothetical protein O7J95_07560 [Planctomycetota bacterium]|nr:hypothetical protein [Planctomycetota bacterium]